jgi:hypothetical protein
MPNLLEAINAKLKEKGLVGEKWHELAAFQGALVQLYRQYYDGEHRLKLTPEMKKMMQITDDRLDRYNANYSETVVHAMSDRLKVSGIAVKSKTSTSAALQDYLKGLGLTVDVKLIADTLQTQFGARDAGDSAQLWIDEIMQANRFDALQIDVHIATLRDGSTYVMSAWEEGKGVVWAHEPAYDGDCGVLVVWDGKRQNLVAGVKIFRSGDAKHVNIYYPSSVEYYSVDGTDSVDEKLVARKEPAKTAKEGVMVGVPIIPFMNKSGDRKRPKSELVNVIPLQDSLNRGLVSLIMAEELTAFRVLLAKGIDIPGGVTPGMVYKTIVNNPNGGGQLIPTEADQANAIAAYYSSIDLKAIEGSPLVQFIEVADFLIGLIGAVSHTPLPQIMGSDSQSGESLKQREVGLLGKVGRAQVQVGNAWEDLTKLSARIQNAFGEKNAPEIIEAVTRWKDAQIRNDGEILTSADWYWNKGFHRESLRVMSQSSLANHTEKDIDRLLAERRADMEEDMTAKAPDVPGFEQFAPLDLTA